MRLYVVCGREEYAKRLARDQAVEDFRKQKQQRAMEVRSLLSTPPHIAWAPTRQRIGASSFSFRSHYPHVPSIPIRSMLYQHVRFLYHSIFLSAHIYAPRRSVLPSSDRVRTFTQSVGLNYVSLSLLSGAPRGDEECGARGRGGGGGGVEGGHGAGEHPHTAGQHVPVHARGSTAKTRRDKAAQVGKRRGRGEGRSVGGHLLWVYADGPDCVPWGFVGVARNAAVFYPLPLMFTCVRESVFYLVFL